MAALVGGAVGILSGLLGIGGGVLIVPFLYLLLALPGWSGLEAHPEHHAALAHATSLALIVPTALSGVLAYTRRGLMDASSLLPLGLGAGGAALIGSAVAPLLPAVLLQVAFGVFLLFMALRLSIPGRTGAGVGGMDSRTGRLPWAVGLTGGGVVGFLSALLGVGGGVVAIPILLKWVRVGIERVAAASLGVIVCAALAGTIGYGVGGLGVEGLPRGALGFVHLPLLFAMLPGAVLAAPLGARWNDLLPASTLRRLFALLLLLMGIRLLWVYLPVLLAGFSPGLSQG